MKKNLAFLAALALVAFALPLSAGPVPIQFCHVVEGTSCTTLGAKRSCTDACGNNLSCTCTYASNPNVRFWHCLIEC